MQVQQQQFRAQNYDEFQQLKEEIQTKIIQESSSHHYQHHPRAHHLSEKHKLGLLPSKSPVNQQQDRRGNCNSKRQQRIVKGNVFKVGKGVFKSVFENGSLGGVQMIGSNVFKLVLQKQTNSTRGNSWFYFSVSGLKGQTNFIISGFRKKKSLFNQGMKICYRNMKEMRWKRGGSQISYSKDNDDANSQNYNVKFTFYFKSDQNCVTEFAYCIPYGLTKLKTLIESIKQKVYMQNLTSSLEGRDLELINIGNLQSKEIIVLSARVHPGQTVSSFIMEGFIKELLAKTKLSIFLRIVPMINVDGVDNGNFRFSAGGVDLNRRWNEPNQDYHPEIYYFKNLILKQKQKQIIMFIDMHGHSRKKNVFFYGCCQQNMTQQQAIKSKFFPYLMSSIHSAFSFKDCSFKIQPQKQGTARICLWKELRIHQIYTLQASFCGNQRQSNYLQADLQRIGRKLCEGMGIYFNEDSGELPQTMRQYLPLRQKLKNQLMSSRQLMQMGNQDNSGSDSEPEAGEKQIIIKVNNKMVINDSNSSNRIKRNYFKDKHRIKNIKIIDYSQLDSLNIKQKDGTIQRKSPLKDTKSPIIYVHQIQTNREQSPINSAVNSRKLRINSAMVKDSHLKNDSTINNYMEKGSNLFGKIATQRERLTTSFQNTQYIRIKNYLKKNHVKSTTQIQQQMPEESKKEVMMDSKYGRLKSFQKVVVPRFYTTSRYKYFDKKVYGASNRSRKCELPSTSKVMCKGTKIGL